MDTNSTANSQTASQPSDNSASTLLNNVPNTIAATSSPVMDFNSVSGSNSSLNSSGPVSAPPTSMPVIPTSPATPTVPSASSAPVIPEVPVVPETPVTPVTPIASAIPDPVIPAPVSTINNDVEINPVDSAKPAEEINLDSNPFFKMPDSNPVSEPVNTDIKTESNPVIKEPSDSISTQASEPLSSILENQTKPATDDDSILSGMFASAPTTNAALEAETVDEIKPEENKISQNFWETPAVKSPEPTTSNSFESQIPNPSEVSQPSQPVVTAPEIVVEPKSEPETKIYPVYMSPSDQTKPIEETISNNTFTTAPTLPEIKPVIPLTNTVPVEKSHRGRIFVLIFAIVALGILAIILGVLLFTGIVK